MRVLLSALRSTAQWFALPLALFLLLAGIADYLTRHTHELEQARTWEHFQQTAARQIDRLRRELEVAVPTDPATAHKLAASLLNARSDARNVSLEIIDLTAAPEAQIVYRDTDPHPTSMTYAELITSGPYRWLVEVSPLPGHYLLTPSDSVRILQWGGLSFALLAALLTAVLQTRARAVRQQVRRQTATIRDNNHRLEKANTALRIEIESRIRAELAQRDSNTLQRAIIDSSEYAIISTDTEGTIQLFNPAAERIFGWTAEEALGRLTPEQFYPAETIAHFKSLYQLSGFGSLIAAANQGQTGEPHETTLQRRNGNRFPANISIWPLHLDEDGYLQGYLGIIADISHHKATEQRIRFLAHYDALTELPNRNLLNLRLSEALDLCQRHDERLAVLFLDLDRFKYVNDSLGHQAGDMLLQAVARRFTACIRGGDTVARMGGDEFVILLPSISHNEQAAEVAERVLHVLRPPFDIRGQHLSITPSIGIAFYPNDGGDEETLIKHADAAMYQTKEEGRNGYRFYTRQLSSHASERLSIENQLRQALEKKEFVLYFQPQIDVANGTLVGVEALLRWANPEHGLVPPNRFIPIAEDSGLIIPIGEWVLRTACAQNHAWQQAGLPAVPVSVNLSARQFDQSDLPERIARVLAETGLAPGLLELELTESLVMRQPERSSEMLNRCKALGLQIAIDDFGTGYSSLAYLRRFPIDRLKIDRSFIRDIVEEPDDAAITQAIIAMAHSLRLTVVAEGVETEAQRRLLRQWECGTYQGFLYSRPLPAEAITDLLASLGTEPASNARPVSLDLA